MITSRSFLLNMRNFSDKSCRQSQNTRLMFSAYFFLNRVVCEVMWNNILEPDRPHMTIWRMCIACWIPKATNRHLECLILTALPLQQWLLKRASVLCDTYIACLVYSCYRRKVCLQLCLYINL
jgi:hypothetical protein